MTLLRRCAAPAVAGCVALSATAWAAEVTPPVAVATPSPALSPPAAAAPLLPPEGLPTAPPPDAIKPVEPRADPALEMEPTAADALPGLEEDASYRYVAIIPGRCERLEVAGRELTDDCRGTLVNIDFGNGRVAFVFVTADPAGTVTTSFSGLASEQPSLGSYRLELDEIVTMRSTRGAAPAVAAVPTQGTCVMRGNPLRESAVFTCAGTGATPPARGAFRSVGTPTVYAGSRASTLASSTKSSGTSFP